MNIYIDFDEVLFATEDLLFEEYKILKSKGIKVDKLKYMQNKNWEELLNKSEIINNAIEILKDLKEVAILTKIHSMENEAVAKIRKLRSLGIYNEVILCPFPFKKSEIVYAKDNVLVDDTIHNLEDWEEKGGIPIFFNKNNSDIDGWDKVNTKYPKIKSLEYLRKYL